jgi:hypothetical protein
MRQPFGINVFHGPTLRSESAGVIAGRVYVAAQAASDERALISWFGLEGADGNGVRRYCGGGGRRPRGSGREGRPWCGGGSPELDEDDRRGYRDQADSHEERQPIAGDQGPWAS